MRTRYFNSYYPQKGGRNKNPCVLGSSRRVRLRSQYKWGSPQETGPRPDIDWCTQPALIYVGSTEGFQRPSGSSATLFLLRNANPPVFHRRTSLPGTRSDLIFSHSLAASLCCRWISLLPWSLPPIQPFRVDSTFSQPKGHQFATGFQARAYSHSHTFGGQFTASTALSFMKAAFKLGRNTPLSILTT